LIAGALVRIAEQTEARISRVQEVAENSIAYLRRQTAGLLTAAAKRVASPNGNRNGNQRTPRTKRGEAE